MNNNYKDYDPKLFKRGFKCDFSKMDLLPELASNGFIIVRNVLGDSQIKEFRKISEIIDSINFEEILLQIKIEQQQCNNLT